MEILIEQRTLANALAIAKRLIAKRNSIPILSNIKLVATDRLELTATNLDVTETITVVCDVIEPGAATIPAHVSADLIKRMSGRLRIAACENDVSFANGIAKMNVQTLPVDDFPLIGPGKTLPATTLTLAAPDLLAALDKVRFAISTEETRYYLNGVLIHVRGDRLRFVSTDGNRLARASLPLPADAPKNDSIVPTLCIDELRKLLAKSRESVTVELFPPHALATGGSIRWSIGDVALWSKLIDGTFPDYERVVPTFFERRASFDTDSLVAALKQVLPAISDRSGAFKLSLSENHATLSVHNPDLGEIKTDLDDKTVAFEGAPFEIGFSARYLLSALATASSESTTMLFNDPSSPAKIECCGDSETFSVLMPLRV